MIFRILTSGETERPQRINEGVTLLANEELIPAAKLTVLPLNPLQDLLNHSTEVDRCPAESGALGWVTGVLIILSPIIDCVSEVCDLRNTGMCCRQVRQRSISATISLIISSDFMPSTPSLLARRIHHCSMEIRESSIRQSKSSLSSDQILYSRSAPCSDSISRSRNNSACSRYRFNCNNCSFKHSI